jgi:hypothetical protein
LAESDGSLATRGRQDSQLLLEPLDLGGELSNLLPGGLIGRLGLDQVCPGPEDLCLQLGDSRSVRRQCGSFCAQGHTALGEDAGQCQREHNGDFSHC